MRAPSSSWRAPRWCRHAWTVSRRQPFSDWCHDGAWGGIDALPTPRLAENTVVEAKGDMKVSMIEQAFRGDDYQTVQVGPPRAACRGRDRQAWPHGGGLSKCSSRRHWEGRHTRVPPTRRCSAACEPGQPCMSATATSTPGSRAPSLRWPGDGQLTQRAVAAPGPRRADWHHSPLHCTHACTVPAPPHHADDACKSQQEGSPGFTMHACMCPPPPLPPLRALAPHKPA